MPYPLRTLSENDSDTVLNFSDLHHPPTSPRKLSCEATGSDWARFTSEEILRNVLHTDPFVGFPRKHMKVSQLSRQTKIKENKTPTKNPGSAKSEVKSNRYRTLLSLEPHDCRWS